MENKKVIIIGASSGIGHALALEFIHAGYTVGITGRRQHLLEEIASEYPGQYHFLAFDVTQTSGVPAHMEQLTRSMGGMDILVISSGGGDVNDTLDFETEKKMIDLNVTGFTCMAGWALNYFIRQGHGHLAAITSIAGLRGSRQAPAYSATKSFQINYLEGLRQKVTNLRLPITVTDIRPGFVDTPMAKSPVKFWLAPVHKAARQIFNAIRRKRKIAYVTKRWAALAWLFRSLPSWLHQRL